MAEQNCQLHECENKCEHPAQIIPLAYQRPNFRYENGQSSVFFCSAACMFTYMYRDGTLSDSEYYHGQRKPPESRRENDDFELEL